MSAPLPEGAFHLLTADDDLAHPYGGFYGGLVAVCGEAMTRSGLRPSCYPPGESAGRDPRYCPECVREAARWSAEAGDRASGAVNNLATR